ASMIVWQLPCESRTSPGPNYRKPDSKESGFLLFGVLKDSPLAAVKAAHFTLRKSYGLRP
ncbi:hypothetical protein, partial [Pseudoalteromonas sp. JW3]|uniref:hypothetical protein n=1 Tax=Pseudoalteromonas sp. JW3 TaxID=1859458 RepID=UPI001C2F4036